MLKNVQINLLKNLFKIKRNVRNFAIKNYILKTSILDKNIDQIILDFQIFNNLRNSVNLSFDLNLDDKKEYDNFYMEIKNKETIISFRDSFEDDINIKIVNNNKSLILNLLIKNKNLFFNNIHNFNFKTLKIYSQNSLIQFIGESIKLENLELNCENSELKISNLIYLYSSFNLNKCDFFCKTINFYKSQIKLKDSQMIIKNIIEINELNPNHLQFDNFKTFLAFKNQKFEVNSKNSILGNDYFLGNIDYFSEENSNVTFNSIIGKEVKFLCENNDNLTINFEDLENNSLIKLRNASLNLKINPFLILGINVFNFEQGKFFKFRMLDKEGVSFCPTLIIDYDKKLEAKEIVNWKIIHPKENWKKFIILSIGISFFYLMTIGREFSNNIYIDYSKFKVYQLFLMKRIESIFEKIENKSSNKNL